jgi:hypothetical protein
MRPTSADSVNLAYSYLTAEADTGSLEGVEVALAWLV